MRILIIFLSVVGQSDAGTSAAAALSSQYVIPISRYIVVADPPDRPWVLCSLSDLDCSLRGLGRLDQAV